MWSAKVAHGTRGPHTSSSVVADAPLLTHLGAVDVEPGRW